MTRVPSVAWRIAFLASCCAAATLPADAQSLFYPKRTTWNVALAYSYLPLGFAVADIPRDLRIHANHRDDPFLTGDAGQTLLERISAGTLDLEAGLAYRPGDVNVALVVSYVAKIPVQEEGRAERQQANDPRPPAYGAYIYTKASRIDVAHAFRTGVAFAIPVSRRRGWWLELQGLLDLGRWPMALEKGWTRFGRDEAETGSEARGFYVARRLKASFGTPKTSFFVSVAHGQVALHYEDSRLANHTGAGVELGLGTQFRF
jgi:hypothetical protein